MTAHELIESNIPVLDYSYTIAEALDQFDDADLNQLVLVQDEHAVGVVHKEDLRFLPDDSHKLDDSLVRDKGLGLNGRLHILEAAKTLSAFDLDIIPVLDDDMKYVGSITRSNVLVELTRLMGWEFPGAVLVLRRLPIDFSMAEITRICESNDCRVFSAGVSLEEGTNALLITLKVDKSDPGALISAFDRYEYEVVAFFGQGSYNDFLKDRYELLMKYLNM